MSKSRKEAEKESFKIIPETCPKVDAALLAAERLIKEQTGDLREALIDAIERANEAEEKVAELEREIELMKEEIEDANMERNLEDR